MNGGNRYGVPLFPTWTGQNSSSPITDVRNTYDKLGRLETVQTYAREGAALTNPEVAKYIYDVIGNLDKIQHSNGIVTDYNYDILNRLKEVIHGRDDNGTPDDTTDDVVVEKFEYTYHANGHKSGEVATDEAGNQNTWNWDYDALGRLVKERHDNHKDDLDYTTDYVFDLVGNRLEKNTDKNGDGVADEQILSEFDQNDRLLNETKVLNGVDTQKTEYGYNVTEQIKKTVTDLLNSRLESKTEMKYNDQGRMSEIRIETYVNGVLSKVVTQEYEYDSSGIKVKQTESVDENADGVDDSKTVTEYLNDDQNHTGYSQVLEEKTSENGGPVKVTTYTIGHDVLAQYDAVNGFLALLTDGHGSTRAVADKLGKILQEYNYDAYGNALGFDPSEALTNLLYSGEQFNAVSGLQYLRARWYNPQSGTFNRLDPFAGDRSSPVTFHKYAYAGMNPITYGDPSGNMLAALNVWMTIYSIISSVSAPNIGLNVIGMPIFDPVDVKRMENLNKFILKVRDYGIEIFNSEPVLKSMVFTTERAKKNAESSIEEFAKWKQNWSFLKRAIDYQQKSYSTLTSVQVVSRVVTLGANGFNPYPYLNSLAPIYIARDWFDGDPVNAVITILHESQHDFCQTGPGHSWVATLENSFRYILDAVSGGTIKDVKTVALKDLLGKFGLKM